MTNTKQDPRKGQQFVICAPFNFNTPNNWVKSPDFTPKTDKR